jgi:hypothetical protein
MGINQMTRHKLLAAKGAAIKAPIPHPLKLKMVNGYRSAEKQLFGHSTTLPGESELGVTGMGTTFGQRMELKRAGMSEANPINNQSSGDSSDLYQSLMSRLSGES